MRFDEDGVQIMSPNDKADRTEPDIVPKERRYAPPAESPDKGIGDQGASRSGKFSFTAATTSAVLTGMRALSFFRMYVIVILISAVSPKN